MSSHTLLSLVSLGQATPNTIEWISNMKTGLTHLCFPASLHPIASKNCLLHWYFSSTGYCYNLNVILTPLFFSFHRLYIISTVDHARDRIKCSDSFFTSCSSLMWPDHNFRIVNVYNRYIPFFTVSWVFGALFIDEVLKDRISSI